MSSNIQFQKENAAAIPNSDSAAQGRLFQSVLDGGFYVKDEAGVVSPITGGFANWIVSAPIVGATYTITLAFETVRVQPSAAVTINLPTAIGISGRQEKIKNITALTHPISVTPFGTEQIEDLGAGVPWIMLTPREFVLLESDGANWMVVG